MSIFSNDFVLAEKENRDELIQLRDQMIEFIGKMKETEKEAYMQAMHQAPQLVEKETNPVRFLRVDNYDANAAAVRLTLYWEKRLQLFGERAYLPMDDLSGNGAMNEADVAVIRAANLARLPNDTGGHPVILSDITQLKQSTSTKIVPVKQNRLRTAVYWNTVLSMENIKSQIEGIVCIRVITTTVFDADHFKKSHTMIDKCAPCKFHQYHFCCMPPVKERNLFLKTVVPRMLIMLGKKFEGRLFVHVGKCPADFRAPLAKYGYTEASIPPSVGGTWCYETYRKSLLTEAKVEDNEDMEKESEHISVPSEGKTAESGGETTGVEGLESNKAALTCLALAASDKAREADRRARKRQMDVIYARGRRQREKRELDELQRKCMSLNEDKNSLEREHSRLEGLIAKAHTIVSAHVSARGPQVEVSEAMKLRRLSSEQLGGLQQGSMLNSGLAVDQIRAAINTSRLEAAIDTSMFEERRNVLNRLKQLQAERSARNAESAIIEKLLLEELSVLRSPNPLSMIGGVRDDMNGLFASRQMSIPRIDGLGSESMPNQVAMLNAGSLASRQIGDQVLRGLLSQSNHNQLSGRRTATGLQGNTLLESSLLAGNTECIDPRGAVGLDGLLRQFRR